MEHAADFISLRALPFWIFGTLLPLWAVGALLLHVGNDAVFKRTWFPRYVVLAGVAFVAIMVPLTLVAVEQRGSAEALAIIFAGGAWIMCHLQIGRTRICSECGAAYVYSDQRWHGWGSAQAIQRGTWVHCSRCGAVLEPVGKPTSPRDPLV
jgi:hypothetical protein